MDEELEVSLPLEFEKPTVALSPSALILPEQVFPNNLFVIPINHLMIYPSLMAPLMIHIPRFVETIEETINRQRFLGLVLARPDEIRSDIKFDELYDSGVIVKIVKRIKLPDGSVNIIVHSMKRFRAKKLLSHHPHFVVEAEYIDDAIEKSDEMDALTRSVISMVKKLSETNPFFTEEMRFAMINAPGPATVADIVAFALALPKAEAQSFLETISTKERFQKLLVHLTKEQELSHLQKKIQDDVNSKINSHQKDYFLREQLRSIKKELGIEEETRDKTKSILLKKVEEAGMPEEVKTQVLDELAKLETIPDASPEYNIVRNYVETASSLPWSKFTQDQLSLLNAEKVLAEDHYGLEKVKERIIEFLAIRNLHQKNNSDHALKASIICLVGPPGVGKTSIGRSIAKTLGRNFYRFSLGGMRDEAEIKGHRRTYVGAMPGKIIQAMRRVKSKNPVILLDEIDKLGQSFQGDPGSALLEVLDPEQNHNFVDHYLDIPFDLSQVLFVATANTISTIPHALLDRMEVIELSGYTLEEKLEIAKKYVIPKVLTESGMKPEQLKIETAVLKKIMSDYSREPGLRTLQHLIEKIARKAAAKILKAQETKAKLKFPLPVLENELANWLGPIRFTNDIAERTTLPGVVVGLAWTYMGGEILFIEAQSMPGSGQMKLTGQMGEVMTESASIAWSYVKKKIGKELNFTQDSLKDKDLHLHIPAGGIPKDGPSAGVTMASALYSLMSQRLAKPRWAMTGELSLVGKVLPVGGIKEKILAAKRAGVLNIVLPKENEKDLSELPEYALKGISLHFVSHVEEVFELVLQKSSRILKTSAKREKKSQTKMKKRMPVISNKLKKNVQTKRSRFQPSH